MSKIIIANKVTRDYLKDINLRIGKSELKLVRIAKCNSDGEVNDIYSFAINKDRREQIMTSDLCTVLAEKMISVSTASHDFQIEYKRGKLNGIAYALILYPNKNNGAKN